MPASAKIRLYRVAAHLMTEVCKRAANPGVAPAGVFLGHFDHQLGQIHPGRRSPSSPVRSPVVLGGDESAVPGEQRLRGHDAAQTAQCSTPERLGADSQSSALVVGKPETAATELLAQYAVLLAKVINDVLLTTVDEASHRHDQELEGEAVHGSDHTVPPRLRGGRSVTLVGRLSGWIDLSSPIDGKQLA